MPASSSAAPSRKFCLEDSQAIYTLAEESSRIGKQVKHAIGVIDLALKDYGLNQLALSFNGGKDCTVLIHLFAASLLRHHSLLYPSSSSTPPALPPLQSVYIRCESPFPQVEAFVTLCTERYSLSLEAVEGGMKEGLGEYIEMTKRVNGVDQGVKAILVGTRRGDPHGATLTDFTPTDKDWPRFMRVHPILDWSYADIWTFLRHPSLTLGGAAGGTIEWCEMYNYGYTSLGSTHNTFPNPLLKATDDPTIFGGWRPAWELKDETTERAGRGSKPISTVEEAQHVLKDAKVKA